jgi:superfamily I DNA/RNA helicase
MDTWLEVRKMARQLHEEALARTGSNRTAAGLITAAREIHDLDLRHFKPGTTFAKGVLGTLDRQSLLINVVEGLSPSEEAFVIGHEIGHFKLHKDPLNEVTVSTSILGGDVIEGGAARVDGYSSRERKEVQADVFAGEFLCPSDWLREQFVTHRKRPSDIATELGIPYGLVLNQCIRALLLPPLRPVVIKPSVKAVPLDDSQRIAATWNKGPLLVDAGPGTGKTRTLVHRVKYLLDQGATPGTILALTFSNRAAEEMRERIAATDPVASIEIWVGTFHAFGKEIITKWPSAVGRTPKVRILDEAGALALLEENLSLLPLNHYQNLYEPAFELVHVLRAISRCKDELITPEAFLEAAREGMKVAAPEDRESAEKALEVGEIYAAYEMALAKADAVDFGDLIALAKKVIESNPEARAFAARYEHVLVDEYQDVNFASSQLLSTICGLKTDVWVVADQRQSIYRFRGAEPSNVSRFPADFKGQKHSLDTNYRSSEQIVAAFAQFSGAMGTPSGFLTGNWNAAKGPGTAIKLTVAPTVDAEAEAIGKEIWSLKAGNVGLGDQVILGRSHLTLARITRVLEQLGVPLVYLGDLFERDEIRTMLSLISIDAEGPGGLIRVAQLPGYNTTRAEAVTVIRWAQQQKVLVFDALKRVEEIQGLTTSSRAGLKRLAGELHGVTSAGPWTLLTTWLFERGEYVRLLAASSEALAKQQLIAIYHLLKLLGEMPVGTGHERRTFLERVRHLEALNQDGAYRNVASEAVDEEAVRVMTIHGSKGLEFRAVHVPGLATAYAPASPKPVRCKPPVTLKALIPAKTDHDDEEACLFFVALSRAREHLHLSRADKYTEKRNSTASKFIKVLQGKIHPSQFAGSGQVFREPKVIVPVAPREQYDEGELATYMRCPARYRYEFVDGIRGAGDLGAFIGFHRCVRRTLGWIERETETGKAVTPEGAVNQLAKIWSEQGPLDHGFEPYYLQTAQQMVRHMTHIQTQQGESLDRGEWQVEIDGKKVLVLPDRVVNRKDGTVLVQQIRTGRRSKSEADKPLYGLLHHGAGQRYVGVQCTVETVYLGVGTRERVPESTEADGVAAYNEAIEGIEHGDFTPRPNQYCPNCPYYFVCGK